MRNKRCCDCHYCTSREYIEGDHACRKLGIHLTRGEYSERHGCVCFKPPEPKYQPPPPESDGRDYEYLLNKESPHAPDGL